MTTIAYKDGLLASDSQASDDTTLCRVRKIARLPCGSIVGYAGSVRKGAAALTWLTSGAASDPPDMDGVCLLVVRPDGLIELGEDAMPLYAVQDKFAAIGCGAAMAVGAMAAGASAVEAVKICCKLDPGTSGPIHTLKLRG